MLSTTLAGLGEISRLRVKLNEAREAAASLFDGIGPPTKTSVTEVGRRESKGKSFLESILAMTPPGFPVPGLLLFGFRELLDLKIGGPEEKIRWWVRFDYKE